MTGDLAQLARWRLCLLAGLSALAGYVGARPRLDLGLALTVLAAVSAAAGCSALNQVQERREDALMARTRGRPLPAGRMRPGPALAYALFCLGAAGVVLAWQNPAALWVLALIVLVYNGVYTPLKKRTPLAVLAGGLAGAAGPLLGAAAAGVSVIGFKTLAVSAALYLWQVPHFWLLAATHGTDYRAAGFACAETAMPTAADTPRTALPRSWLGWLGAAMLLPAAFAMSHPVLRTALAVVALATALGANTFTLRRRPGKGFAAVNFSMAAFLAILAADSLLPRP